MHTKILTVHDFKQSDTNTDNIYTLKKRQKNMENVSDQTCVEKSRHIKKNLETNKVTKKKHPEKIANEK